MIHLLFVLSVGLGIALGAAVVGQAMIAATIAVSCIMALVYLVLITARTDADS